RQRADVPIPLGVRAAQRRPSQRMNCVPWWVAQLLRQTGAATPPSSPYSPGRPSHLLVQPGFGKPPFALDGGHGDAEDIGNLIVLESTEEPHFDYLGLSHVGLSQSIENGIEVYQFAQHEGRIGRCTIGEVQRNTFPIAAALLCMALSHIIDE